MACASTLINNAQYAAEWYFKLSRAYSDGTLPGTPPPFIVDPNDYNDGDTPGNAKYWSDLGETSLAAYAGQASASATNAELKTVWDDGVNTYFKFYTKFASPIDLVPDGNDRYEFVVQDDLSGVVSLTVRADGSALTRPNGESL